jgi:hypothetical protein
VVGAVISTPKVNEYGLTVFPRPPVKEVNGYVPLAIVFEVSKGILLLPPNRLIVASAPVGNTANPPDKLKLGVLAPWSL